MTKRKGAKQAASGDKVRRVVRRVSREQTRRSERVEARRQFPVRGVGDDREALLVAQAESGQPEEGDVGGGFGEKLGPADAEVTSAEVTSSPPLPREFTINAEALDQWVDQTGGASTSSSSAPVPDSPLDELRQQINSLHAAVASGLSNLNSILSDRVQRSYSRELPRASEEFQTPSGGTPVRSPTTTARAQTSSLVPPTTIVTAFSPDRPLQESGSRSQFHSRPLSLAHLPRLTADCPSLGTWFQHAEQELANLAVLQGSAPTERQAVALVISRFDVGTSAAIWAANLPGGMDAEERSSFSRFRESFFTRFVSVGDRIRLLQKLDEIRASSFGGDVTKYYEAFSALANQLQPGQRSAFDLKQNFLRGLPSESRTHLQLFVAQDEELSIFDIFLKARHLQAVNFQERQDRGRDRDRGRERERGDRESDRDRGRSGQREREGRDQPREAYRRADRFMGTTPVVEHWERSASHFTRDNPPLTASGPNILPVGPPRGLGGGAPGKS